jgi:uncharacterized Zn finger protein
MSWGWYPKRRRRIKPVGGIQAKNKRGRFGESWWAQRWTGVLESFGWDNRLARGRSYARGGQVLSIDIAKGKVKARVQGSRPKPYNIEINLPALTARQWKQAIEAMAGQAIFAAKLLAGEMPQDIEGAFKAAGVPLFPRSASDIRADCSCPDFANPCKHIAAVYYLLGEQFDEDPFLLFVLRGRTKDEIIEGLRTRRAEAVAEEPAASEPAPDSVPPLAGLLATYYQAGGELRQVTPRIAGPEVEAPWLRRLGAPPASTLTDLSALYQAMTVYALNKVFGEGQDIERPRRGESSALKGRVAGK